MNDKLDPGLSEPVVPSAASGGVWRNPWLIVALLAMVGGIVAPERRAGRPDWTSTLAGYLAPSAGASANGFMSGVHGRVGQRRPL